MKKIISSREQIAEANAKLGWADSYSRAKVLLDLYASMDETEWLKVFAEWWDCCDSCYEITPQLKAIFNKYPSLEFLNNLSVETQKYYADLPEEITIYRGCYSDNMDGLSWSYSREIACSFPLLNRYRRPEQRPILVTAKVNKQDCVVFLGREEQEIFTTKARLVSVQDLSEV